MPREFDEIHGQFANGKKIACKDCAFRDKTEIEINGKTIKTGVTKCYCEVFKKEERQQKPMEVLFQNAECPAYLKG